MNVLEPRPRRRGGARFAAALFVGFLLQTVVVPTSWAEVLAPDFILAAVAGIAMAGGAGAAIGYGALAGLLQDSFSGGFLGMHGFSKPLVAFAVARLARVVRTSSRSATLALVLFAVVADVMVLWVLGVMAGEGVVPGRMGAIVAGFGLTVPAGWLAARLLRQPRREEFGMREGQRHAPV